MQIFKDGYNFIACLKIVLKIAYLYLYKRYLQGSNSIQSNNYNQSPDKDKKICELLARYEKMFECRSCISRMYRIKSYLVFYYDDNMVSITQYQQIIPEYQVFLFFNIIICLPLKKWEIKYRSRYTRVSIQSAIEFVKCVSL